MADKYYKLQGSDQVIIEVEESAVMMSTILRDKLQAENGFGVVGGGDGQQAPIQIENITGAILRMVFCWCEHHSHEDEPTAEVELEQAISVWDKDFISVERDTFLKVLDAARLLGIGRLIVLCLKHFADMIRDNNMTREQTSQFLRLSNDVPPEEEERILRREPQLDHDQE